MLLELLRLFSMILRDIATSAQAAEDDQDTVEVTVGEENQEDDNDEGDGSSFVQTETNKRKKGKQGAEEDKLNKKKEKLEKSAVTGSVADKAGNHLARLLSTLLAAMDSMNVAEAQACAQEFLNRIQIHYQGLIAEQVGENVPMEAQEVIAGMVAYGG